MIDDLEELLREPNGKLSEFWNLYLQVKSAIHYSSGIRGKFNHQVNYNIETLVNTLLELERNELHPLYPFIATWNSKFASLAGVDFKAVTDFKNRILDRLKDWVQMKHKPKGAYYRGFKDLQRDTQHPLRVFSLNYDLCVEGISAEDFKVEAWFATEGDRFVWDWRRFDDREIDLTSPNLLLYKMHGSIDWIREIGTDRLLRVDYAGDNITPDKMVVIFGRDIKLEAADPFLFYAYEFRRFCLDSKLIVSVGYGFADTHINKIISQSLRQDPMRRLLIVRPLKSTHAEAQVREDVANQLTLNDSKAVRIANMTAQQFFEQSSLKDYLLSHFADPEDVPF